MKLDYKVSQMQAMSQSEFLVNVVQKCKMDALAIEMVGFDPAIGKTLRHLVRQDLEGTPLKTTNGRGWWREHTGLGSILKVVALKDKNGLYEIWLDGYKNQVREHTRHIPENVKAYYRTGPQICAFCCIKVTGSQKKPQIDHCCGRYNDPNFDKQDPLAYQLLCARHNTWKRTVCGKCKSTGRRFDARKFCVGEALGWHHGTMKYEGTCKGCIVHNVRKWRIESSSGDFDLKGQFELIRQSEEKADYKDSVDDSAEIGEVDGIFGKEG